jgi:hypothetical protein
METKLSDDEKAVIESLNCEDPFRYKKSPTKLINMRIYHNEGYAVEYDSIPSRKFTHLDNKEQ